MDLIARNEAQLAASLRRYRKKAGLTQGALGEVAQLRQSTISELENGSGAKLETVFAILSALNLELVVRPRNVGGEPALEDLF
ncbi:helix-turn-helix domain-containing protein [Caulobacter rhizosphaerae]|uniref:helix-turn-helix domain-containing protein n=1 Tax=Caulobacter rhizosphaerae TaxID=2010972 RepID=UPI0013D738CD|nr:helix-turn-helix domain-containing protein [Caulobacter rhizosphaerae]GGL36059.1 transcriptional regulator [Caulobacter rhizosphaerae]